MLPELTSENFWIIEAQADYWQWTTAQLIKKHRDPQNEELVVLGTEGPHLVYYIPKTLLTAEQIAAHFGATLEQVVGVERIILKPSPKWDNSIEPNTPQWGEA